MNRGGKGHGTGNGSKKASGAKNSAGAGKKDKLNASGIINLTEYIEEARGERVSRLKSDVESGIYTVDADKVAERIIARAAKASRKPRK